MDFLNNNQNQFSSPSRQNKKSPLESLKEKMLISESEDSVSFSENKAQAFGFSVNIPQEESFEPIFTDNKPEVLTNEQEPALINEEPYEENTPSLLEKLQRYTTDESGQNMAFDQKPLYELQSVADILKSESESVMESLSKKYDVTFDHLGKPEPTLETETEEKKEEKKEDTSDDGQTIAFKKLVSDSQKQQSGIFLEQETRIIETDFSLPHISDIDAVQLNTTPANPTISDTATIRFTPVTNEKGDTQRISVSSITKPINLSLDINPQTETQPSSTELELSDFEAYEPKIEMQSADDFRKVARILAIKKRSAFVSVMLSFISLLGLVVFFIPALADIFIGNAKLGMIITGSIWALGFLANLDIFKSLFTLRKRQENCDLLLVLPAISTTALIICSVLQNASVFHLILVSAISLFARALTKFLSASAILSNFKIANKAKSIKSLSLISEPSTTYAMAKNSIEGDVLVAAPRKVEFVSNFMKHSTYSVALQGKLKAIFFVALILSVVCSLGAGIYYNGVFYALYCLCALCCLTALPTLFLIDSLPVFSAAKKLNRKGCMIAGKAAAEKIELANAAAIPVADLFPSGSITLNDMKVLTNNNIDRTLINAAALCDAMNSPLTPIFKNIANTSDDYPTPSLDTLKYEERLGISGWVDDELLFIGNRTLLEAHGIAVPSVEVDRRILRNGFFPVYVARKDAACAMLIVKYSADSLVTSALRKVTNLGVTLLISNCDPNINEEMIADYFGLYSDMLKVMSNAGVHILKTATAPRQSYSAPAVFSGSAVNFISVINCASKIKKSNAALTVLYALAAVLGFVYFAYAAFAGSGAMPQLSTVLLYQLAASAVSTIIYLFTKP